MILVDLLPLIIAAAVLPLWIIISLLLLRGEGGVLRSAAFSGGAMTVRVVQGLLFGFVFGASADAGDAARANLIKSTLLLVLGILMLVAAYKKWRKEEDPDAPPPKWMTILSGMSALKAFGAGALLMTIAIKQWIFTLSAIATIGEAQLDQVTSTLVYLFFVVAAQSLMLAPIVVTIVAPAQSAKVLGSALGWLERNNRPITVAVSLIFGVWFTWQGITGILA
jgi:hypothetical protein